MHRCCKYDEAKYSQIIYKTPLFLFHVAFLFSWLAGVRPAVDLSWKALLYMLGYHASTALCGSINGLAAASVPSIAVQRPKCSWSEE